MIEYPVHFKVKTLSGGGAKENWAAASLSHATELPMAIPEEFEGPGGAFSPEDLYAIALQDCFVATFKRIASTAKLVFDEIRVQSDLTVDRDDSGTPWMSSIIIDVTLTGVDDPGRATEILERTKHLSFILNSVRTRKVFNFNVRGRNS